MKHKGLLIAAGVVLVILLLCGKVVGIYNDMVAKQETATTALSDMEATYQRRADLLPNFAKSVKAMPSMRSRPSRK